MKSMELNDVCLFVCLFVFGATAQAYSTFTVQHSHLNRKNVIQNQKYKCKNNTKLIYLTFIHCTCKFEKHKKSFSIENYEQTFPNKNHKQSNVHEKHKQAFPRENYNRTFHN
jgi:hypothetical protein